MRFIDIITVLSLALSTSAKLETEGIKLPLPTRELEWKDVNFISISDSHGTSHPPLIKLMDRLATRSSTCKLPLINKTQKMTELMDRQHGLNLYATPPLYLAPLMGRTIQAIMGISLLSLNTSSRKLWIRALIC